MGRMKDIFMEVVQQDGTLPENFNLGEYMYKKKLENEEWQKATELKNLQGTKNAAYDEKLDENSCNNKKT
jgi:hypothetical protein